MRFSRQKPIQDFGYFTYCLGFFEWWRHRFSWFRWPTIKYLDSWYVAIITKNQQDRTWITYI